MTAISAGVELRLAKLEARHEIEDLLAHYCVAVDDRDMEALAACFTPDGCLIGKDGRPAGNGRVEVMTRYKSRFADLGPTYHWTHNHVIKVADDVQNATGLVLSHAEIWRDGVAHIAALRYEDIYRHHEGRWRIASRTTGFFYYMPIADYPTALGAPDRMRAYGDRRPANFPEPLDSWRDWPNYQP